MRAAPLRWALPCLLAALPAFGAPRGGCGDPAAKRACSEAHVEFQKLRRGGKLIAARERALACASAKCPSVLQRECEPAVRELTELIPSVVASARDAKGDDVMGTKVLLDGEPWVDRLTGVSTPLDPGPHVLTFVAPGEAPVRVELVINFARFPGGGATPGFLAEPPLVRGAFSHVVVTADAARAALYVNGELAREAGSFPAAAPTTEAFTVGDRSGRFSPFVGVIDELALYDKALEPSVVLEHYQLGVGLAPGGLRAAGAPAR